MSSYRLILTGIVIALANFTASTQTSDTKKQRTIIMNSSAVMKKIKK